MGVMIGFAIYPQNKLELLNVPNFSRTIECNYRRTLLLPKLVYFHSASSWAFLDIFGPCWGYFWDWDQVQKYFWDLLTQTNNFCFGSKWFLQLFHTFLGGWLGGWLDQLRIQPPQPPTKAGVWAGAEFGNTKKVTSISIGIGF